MKLSLSRFAFFAGVLAVATGSLSSSSVWAYKKEYHFYVTYMLANWCGLDQIPGDYVSPDFPVAEKGQAFEMALSNFSTDSYEETDAGANVSEWFDISKEADRRLYHFPIDQGQSAVTRGSAAAMAVMNQALDKANAGTVDPTLAGVSLHTFQDSFSHETYGALFGHMLTTKPDYPQYDVQKAMEMAEGTWIWLDKWSTAVRKTPCSKSWQTISSLIENWSGEHVADGTELATNWRKYSQSITGNDVDPQVYTALAAWREHFLGIALKLRKTAP
jgi:hypothetical protein